MMNEEMKLLIRSLKFSITLCSYFKILGLNKEERMGFYTSSRELSIDSTSKKALKISVK